MDRFGTSDQALPHMPNAPHESQDTAIVFGNGNEKIDSHVLTEADQETSG